MCFGVCIPYVDPTGQGKEYDVVVVSPLRRTIQTAHIALAGRASLFVVDPESTETADPIWGLPQRGSSVEDLTAAFPFLSSPDWDISALTDKAKWCEDKPGEWVHPKSVEERLEPFMAGVGAS